MLVAAISQVSLCYPNTDTNFLPTKGPLVYGLMPVLLRQEQVDSSLISPTGNQELYQRTTEEKFGDKKQPML